MTRVAIIGGGVSGAAAAYFLRAKQNLFPSQLKIDLYESSHRLGGRIFSEYRNSLVLERGAEGLSGRDTSAMELMEDLGLELVRPAALPLGIGCGGQFEVIDPEVLRPSLRGLRHLLGRRLISTRGKLETALRVLTRSFRDKDTHETSLARYLEESWGSEAAQRIFAPVYSGIYGGSADELSSRLAERLQGGRCAGPTKSALFSIATGMSSLVERFVELSGAQVHLESPITKLFRDSDRWLIADAPYDAVALCIPAPQAGALLLSLDQEAAKLLSAIRFTSVITVLLEIEPIDLPEASGCLMQRQNGLRAVSFVSQKWGHSSRSSSFVRGFFSPHRHLEDHDLITLLVNEIEALCGVRPRVISSLVDRWEAANPLLSVGYERIGARISEAVKALPGVFIPAGVYHGAGITDCINGARRSADLMADYLTSFSAVRSDYEHRISA
ncbi:MAG: hypothetical protein DCC75_03765 [Proteobacteria bacterium]|nr:MAG: hypothetical protein DCC75_03765 [Pseudomonadota bacterium]